MDTKVLTAHVPLPLAEKVDQIAGRLERNRVRLWLLCCVQGQSNNLGGQPSASG